MNAGTVFNELMAATPFADGRGYREFDCAEGLHLRAFVDGRLRLPGVSLRAKKTLVPMSFVLPKLRGVTVAVSSEGGGARDGDVLYEYTAASTAYADVFIALASRLIDDAANEVTALAALHCMANRVATWANFFDERGEDGMARWQELGLIGELHCLATLADLIGLPAAINGWTGPNRAPHDFSFPAGAVEAKLTTSSAPERFRIASERQLDETMVACLLLYAVVAQEVASGQVALGKMVDDCRERIERYAPEAKPTFEEKLLRSGFCDADRKHYEIRLAVHHAAFLHVKDDFPRVRAAELREGVFNLRYDVSWAAVAPYRIDHDEAKEKLNVR